MKSRQVFFCYYNNKIIIKSVECLIIPRCDFVIIYASRKQKFFPPPFFFLSSPNYYCVMEYFFFFSKLSKSSLYIFLNYKILLSSGVMEENPFFFNYFLNLKYKVLFCILLVKLQPLVRENNIILAPDRQRDSRERRFLPYSSAINWILNCSFGKNNNLMNLIDNK